MNTMRLLILDTSSKHKINIEKCLSAYIGDLLLFEVGSIKELLEFKQLEQIDAIIIAPSEEQNALEALSDSQLMQANLTIPIACYMPGDQYKEPSFFCKINAGGLSNLLLDAFPQNFQTEVLSDSIFVKVQHKLMRVGLEEILVIEADGNYITIFTNKKKYVVKTSLKQLSVRLPSHKFMRIHRNYMVQSSYVESIDAVSNEISVAGQNYPIGNKYRPILMKSLNKII